MDGGPSANRDWQVKRGCGMICGPKMVVITDVRYGTPSDQRQSALSGSVLFSSDGLLLIGSNALSLDSSQATHFANGWLII